MTLVDSPLEGQVRTQDESLRNVQRDLAVECRVGDLRVDGLILVSDQERQEADGPVGDTQLGRRISGIELLRVALELTFQEAVGQVAIEREAGTQRAAAGDADDGAGIFRP